MKKLLLVLTGAALLTACDDTPNIVGKYESADNNKELYARVEQSPKDKEMFRLKGRFICKTPFAGITKLNHSFTFNLKDNKLIEPHSNKEKVIATFNNGEISMNPEISRCKGEYKKVK